MSVITLALYLPGLGGGFIFDDYPNIVDNSLVQPKHATVAELSAAALSSPSSELKRPLASLSFAANVLAGGLDASAMKATNIAIHILNGWLVFALCTQLLQQTHPSNSKRKRLATAFAVSLAWLVAPINLTAVLYVVQRMESLANLFILAGLIGYSRWRLRARPGLASIARGLSWLILPTLVGLMAKETAVLLPAYALCVEAIIFRFRYANGTRAWSLIAAFSMLLGPALLLGGIWLVPALLDPMTWGKRDFTLVTRLLSEPRVLIDYLAWSIWPTPSALSFYHDDFIPSVDAFHPWTTLTAMGVLVMLGVSAWKMKRKRPLLSLGIAWFFACHALTGTVLPLELVYEHRNYFASLGVFLALADVLLWIRQTCANKGWPSFLPWIAAAISITWSIWQTTSTSYAWGNPLRLAEELGKRGPDSPRAQYELGRAYIIQTHYDPTSPFVKKAYGPLERAAVLPGASILPEQALIFLNSRSGLPLKTQWWSSMIEKLKSRPATVQDESSLDTLSRCLGDGGCQFPIAPLEQAFEAATNHPGPSGRLLAIYASFASVSMRDSDLAYQLQKQAVAVTPTEPVYRIGLARMAIGRGDSDTAREQIAVLHTLNVGGRLTADIRSLSESLHTGSHQR